MRRRILWPAIAAVAVLVRQAGPRGRLLWPAIAAVAVLVRQAGPRGRLLWPAIAAVAVLVAGCSSSSTSTSTTSSSARGSGKVQVLYAGSLVNAMEKTVGPAFSSATGYTYQGRGAGAVQLANQIKAKTLRGDVFISASPGPDKALEGTANGDWVSWYSTIGTSALVLAYNPNSKFADDLKSKPWTQVLTEPGIRLGRTDPKLDPKGQLTVAALDQAAKNASDPSLASTVENAAQVFPEEELVGRLQSGQLDAGFFYTLEASVTKLPTVGLNLPDAHATYTVTVLNNGSNAAGGIAFVTYLLSPQGRDQLTAAGMSLTPKPTLAGPSSAVPADLRELVGG